jgi:leader peptidase (prepilin peptidase)/N-methyltransferase
LVALSLIDLRHFILPNRIVFPLAIVVPALLALGAIGDRNGGALVRSLLGGVAGFAALFVLHVISPRSMGFGDVKLSFVLGLALGWLGWGELVLGLFLGFLYGAVVGAGLMILRRRGRKDQVPFGPFLAAGTLTVVLWGDAILRWAGYD